MTPEYRTWQNIIDRCERPGNKCHKNYGGRGITVAPEWRNDFNAFLSHVGERPGPRYTIERIDNDHGYKPGNVRWATRMEQGANKRNNINITIDGETHHVAEWCRRHGVKCPTACVRLQKGWDPVLAVTTPGGSTRRP